MNLSSMQAGSESGTRYNPETDSFSPPELPMNLSNVEPEYSIFEVVGNTLDRVSIQVWDSEYSLPGAINIADIKNRGDRSRTYIVARTNGGMIEYDHEGKLHNQLEIPKDSALSVVKGINDRFSLTMASENTQ